MGKRGKKEYLYRALILKRAGFKNYQDYLASDLWNKIRAKQLREHPQCHGCGEIASQVHHGKYTLPNMLGHSNEHLFSVCAGCHFTAEFSQSGRKLTPQQATGKLRRNRRRRIRLERSVLAVGLAERRSTVDTEFRDRLEREN